MSKILSVTDGLRTIDMLKTIQWSIEMFRATLTMRVQIIVISPT